MTAIHLAAVDYAILIAYTVFVVGIGFALKRYMKSSSDFLTSGRSIPAWVTGLAFISANLGALELVGMAASGAKYGIATCHFYWVGAIPAMVFLAVFMMPFYYGSKARSVPEYLKLRFDERTRCFNSMTFAVMTIFASGISMNALAKLLNQLLGWDYNISLWICSAVVLVYVLKGGLTSAIYTEVLQFFMIVLGFAPVVYLGLKDVGGWDKLKTALSAVAQQPAALGLAESTTKTYPTDAWTSAWKPLLAGSNSNPMGVDWFAMVFGLGFVLSFGYWCTNFLVVQRAMAAKNMSAARRTPLIAAVPKMIFPVLVILPGMIAVGLAHFNKDGYQLPKKAAVVSDAALAKGVAELKTSAEDMLSVADAANAVAKAVGSPVNQAKIAALLKTADTADTTTLSTGLKGAVEGQNDYDGVILSLVKKYCPSGLLGLALTALLASFMSGMAGNVTAFNTVWTYDLYQTFRRLFVDTPAPHTIEYADGRKEDVIITRKEPSDRHFFWMGQTVTVVGILLSIAAAYFASNYNNAMDVIQLVFGFVNAPLFATFLLGMFWARATAHGAFFGLVGGTGASALVHGLTLAAGNNPGVKGGYLTVVQVFPSEMAQNFWLATIAFLVCFGLTVGISLFTRRTKTDDELKGLVYSLTPRIKTEEKEWYLRPGLIGVLLLIACVILNFIYW